MTSLRSLIPQFTSFRAAIIAIASLSAGTASADTFSSTDTPKSIPDNDLSGITSVISVPMGTGVISDLNVSLTINHTWVGDFIITLTSPSGTTQTIIHRPDFPNIPFGDGANFVGGPYTFDDEASGPFPENTSGDDIPFGTYQPTDEIGVPTLLSVFDGEIADGNWTLSVADVDSTETGTLNSWDLVLTASPSSTATPAQLDLLIGKTGRGLRGKNVFERRKATSRQTITYARQIFQTNISTAHLLIRNDGGTAARFRLRSIGDQFPRMSVVARSGGRNVSAAVQRGRFSSLIAGGGSVRLVYRLRTDRYYAGVLRGGDRHDTIRFRLTGAGKSDNAAMVNRYR